MRARQGSTSPRNCTPASGWESRAEGLRWPAFDRSSRRAAAAPEVTALHPQPGPSRGCSILGPSDAPSGPENSPSAHANRKAATRAAISSGRPSTTAVKSSPSTQARWSRFRARQDHRSVQVRRPRPATDGTETAVAALWGKVDASGGDPPAVSLVPVPPLSTATISSSPARRASQRSPPPMSRSRPRATPLAAFILSSFGTRPRP